MEVRTGMLENTGSSWQLLNFPPHFSWLSHTKLYYVAEYECLHGGGGGGGGGGTGCQKETVRALGPRTEEC